MIRVEGIPRTEVPRRFVLAFMAGLSAAACMSAEMYLGVLVEHVMKDPFNGIGD